MYPVPAPLDSSSFTLFTSPLLAASISSLSLALMVNNFKWNKVETELYYQQLHHCYWRRTDTKQREQRKP